MVDEKELGNDSQVKKDSCNNFNGKGFHGFWSATGLSK